RQPEVTLGNILQMNLIELNKADRLGLPDGPLRAWITFFTHWREELTMAKIAHEPVKRAMSRIRELSADEEARRLAFVRERALRDEVSQLNEARQEGLQEGQKKGRQEGLQEGLQEGQKKGRQEANAETARNLIKTNALNDEQIAQATGLTQEEVAQLRSEQQE
ncbi:hypothetical protein CKO08_12610, partial [Halorhodospira halochloris]|nr:hypothetical protein [Halorhodospira halochloris]